MKADALPQAFRERMQAMLGRDFPAFLESYEQAPLRALRVNTARLSPADFAALSPWALRPLPGQPDAFVLAEDAAGIGRHPYHIAGLFYMQEPSAMAPVAALAPGPGMRVLDLCAAPGGKAGAIAARIGETGLLVANEIVPGRAKTLLENLQRLGVGNALVTSMEPGALCASLPAYFDAVLVDAPCSGEGMFRKDPLAVREWSKAHVHACARRQAGILQSAAKALRPGGRLVYATCTFSPEENEETAAAFLRAHPAFSLVEQRRLYPHRGEGEGQYYAVFAAKETARAAEGARRSEKPHPLRKKACASGDAQREAAAGALLSLFPGLPAERLHPLPDGRLFLLPEAEAPLKKGLHMLCAGVAAGEMRKGRFVPSQALFQRYGAGCAQLLSFAPGDALLQAFLRGEAIPLPPHMRGAEGYCAVCADGFPLGFGKAGGGLLKNHFPKSSRLKE